MATFGMDMRRALYAGRLDRTGICRTLPGMSDSAPTGLLLVLSGPSGVGKTTIAHRVQERFDGIFSVSATTRPRSSDEVDGEDYTFVDPETFQTMLDAGEFLESAEVFGKHAYGTPRGPVQRRLDEGRLVILDIDVQGARQIRDSLPESFMLFILPPSEEELQRRLEARGRDDEEAIQRRFAEARHEIELATTSDLYDAFVVNADLETAIQETCELIAARMQHGPRESTA
tara:strand:+ start:2686 stop:3375 length:690 start_codon:yes stop_codon:yes gene_type:complete